MRALKIAVFVLALTVPAAVPGQGAEPRAVDAALPRLEMEIGRAAKLAEGTVGVSALHFESGQRISFNAKERFPMASTYKLPIAVQILTLVDRRELTLERMIEVQQKDLHPGSGVLTTILSKPGLSLSVHNLLELMLLVSDNSATDLLLSLAGGPQAVTGRMRSLGLADMVVNRPTVRLIADSTGYSLPPEEEWRPEMSKKLYDGTTKESRKNAAQKFLDDPRDTTTPESMISLIEKTHRREALSPENTSLLFEILERCQTGRNRIRGFLLPDTVVAHKTGTIAGTASDVGRITLPDGAGHVAVAIYLKGMDKEAGEKERTIAQISRAIYDFFLFRRP
jgi:beta-lactamase class A